MSAPVLHTPGREADDAGVDPTAEAAHLRRLIEGQPSCVMRIDLEGQLLAVNGAALGLLGALDLDQALSRNLPERIVPDHRSRWRDFAARIGGGQPASMECDLTNFAGNERSVLLQGVPLLDHPDAVPSVIVSARDTSATRRLEQVLEKEVEIELDAAIDEQRRVDEIQQELDAARVEQARLELLLAEQESRHASALAQLQQTLAEEHQLALMQAERDARQLSEAAAKELEQARTELEHVRTALEHSRSECERLETSLREVEEARKRSDADLASAAQLREQLEAELAQSREERSRIEGAQAESARLRDDLKAAHEAEALRLREALRTAHEAETLRLRDALKTAQEAESLRLREEIRSEHQVELARLRQELEDGRGAEAAHVAEQVKREHEAEIAQLKDELKGERQTARHAAEKVTSVEVLQGTLDAARLECERLRSVVGQQEAERERLLQLQTAALENVRALLAEERELALLGKERDARRRIDEAETGLTSALEERQRLRSVLQDSENERARLLAEQASQRIEAEHALAAVSLAKDRVTKAYTDQQVELNAVVGNTLVLEAITGAGRIAREVGRDLQDAARSIDRRVQQLLARTPLDSDNRTEIEALRSEAMAIASLARQILPADPADHAAVDQN